MRLKLEGDHGARRAGSEYGVFDETAGKYVGTVSFEATRATPQGPFDCSTPSTSASSTRTWNALVKGVEVVLDYMLKVKDVKSAKSLLNHLLEAKEKPAEPEE